MNFKLNIYKLVNKYKHIYIYKSKYINNGNSKIAPILVDNKIASGIKLAPLPLTPTYTLLKLYHNTIQGTTQRSQTQTTNEKQKTTTHSLPPKTPFPIIKK